MTIRSQTHRDKAITHALDVRGRRMASHAEGHAALAVPWRHDAQSEKQPEQKSHPIKTLTWYRSIQRRRDGAMSRRIPGEICHGGVGFCLTSPFPHALAMRRAYSAWSSSSPDAASASEHLHEVRRRSRAVSSLPSHGRWAHTNRWMLLEGHRRAARRVEGRRQARAVSCRCTRTATVSCGKSMTNRIPL